MVLNITYTAWAIVFTVIILGDFSVLNPTTLFFASVVVVCGILAATDIKKAFKKESIILNVKKLQSLCDCFIRIVKKRTVV